MTQRAPRTAGGKTSRKRAAQPAAAEAQAWASPLRIQRAAVYAGTCSWADTHFVKEGKFYPPEVAAKPAARLQYYATVFPTVEIDATFYALLDPEMADRWVEWTPKEFVFHAKAFGLFTGHAIDPRRLPADIQRLLPAGQATERKLSFRELPKEVEEACWEHFVELARRLNGADRLGYILFQFPRWYVPSPGLFRRLEQIRRLLDGYQLAVEFRHRSWVDDAHREDVVAALRQNDLIYTIVDEPELAWTVPPVRLVTSDWSLVRFHGRNAAAWGKRGTTTNDVYNYLYSREELKPWVKHAQELAGQVKKLFLMFNNHYRGSSAKNAQMLVEMLERR